MSEPLASVPPPKRICPTCKIPLYVASLGGQELHHCAECKGMAWARAALTKLRPDDAKQPLAIGIEERGHQRPPYFTPRQKPPFLICPLCSKRMKETKLAATPVDLCEKCTCMWVDGPKAERFPDLLSPYKWRLLKDR